MKRIKAIIILTLLLLVPVIQAFAEVKPYVFRDLYWGESIEEIQAKRKTEYIVHDKRYDTTLYFVSLDKNESKFVSGIPLESSFKARLWKNRLFEIVLYFPSGSQTKTDALMKSLNEALEIRYGKLESKGENWISYRDNQTGIVLSSFPTNSYVKITLTNIEAVQSLIDESNDIALKKKIKRANQGW